MESRFLEPSVSRTSRYLEPNLVSLGFASLKLYNLSPISRTPDFSKLPITRTKFGSRGTNWPSITRKFPNHLPSIASTRERTPTKHVFTWRQTSKFQVSNVQVFPPNCEVLLLELLKGKMILINKKGRNYQKGIKWKNLRRIIFLRSLAKIRVQFQKTLGTTPAHYTSYLGGKPSKFDS